MTPPISSPLLDPVTGQLSRIWISFFEQLGSKENFGLDPFAAAAPASAPASDVRLDLFSPVTTSEPNVEVLRVNGLTVVGPRQAAVTNPAITTTGTAGSAYNAAVQAMINALKTDVTNLQATIATVISRLAVHGLTY